MHEPLVSIIIPMYNAESFISETIDSVIQQAYTDWELIIVDDGSTNYCNRYPTIHYYHQQNLGVSYARNNGIESSKGEFIALLDADDLWHKENLQKKVNYLIDNPDVDWVYSDMSAIDENGVKIDNPEQGKGQDVLRNILLWNGEVVPGACSNLVFRKKCIQEDCSFDTQFSTAADQDFTIQLASKFTSHYIKERLWSYRIINNSMSRNIAIMEKDHIGVYKKAQINGLFTSFAFRRKCFSNMYLILGGSWWKDGNNKPRGLYFIIRSVVCWPSNIFNVMKKRVH